MRLIEYYIELAGVEQNYNRRKNGALVLFLTYDSCDYCGGVGDAAVAAFNP